MRNLFLLRTLKVNNTIYCRHPYSFYNIAHSSINDEWNAKETSLSHSGVTEHKKELEAVNEQTTLASPHSIASYP